MTDWIKTKAGLQMAETIIRHLPKLGHPGSSPETEEAMIVIQKYLPRVTICLEEIALGLNYLRRLENKEKKNE
jgi:formylmethanofuran dehydrogenase subunit A